MEAFYRDETMKTGGESGPEVTAGHFLFTSLDSFICLNSTTQDKTITIRLLSVTVKPQEQDPSLCDLFTGHSEIHC